MNDSELSKLMVKAERFALKKCGFCGHTDYNKIRNRKFAQLIVKECAKINEEFIGRRIGEIDLNIVYKEHFGGK